jgi:hypothetical protein
MNEQDNVALISEIYTAFNAGNIQTILDSITDDVVWINYGPATIPYAGARSGKAQVLQFFQAIAGSTTGGHVTSEAYIAQGDIVVSIGRYSATVTSTGATIDAPIAHVFTVQNGKVSQWVGHSDTAAIAAAHTGAAAAAGN